MKYWCPILSLLVFLTSPAIAMPRGAYLKRPAPTSASLLSQVKKNASVRQRYALLGNISEKEVIARLSGLRLMRLPQAVEARVYYWRIEIGFHHKVLKPGTEIFATPDGIPVLLQVCGNPLEMIPEPIPKETPTSPEDPLLGPRPTPTSLVTLERDPEIALTSDPIPTIYIPDDPLMISLRPLTFPRMDPFVPFGFSPDNRLPWGAALAILSLGAPSPKP
jgi:hypothetical protein